VRQTATLLDKRHLMQASNMQAQALALFTLVAMRLAYPRTSLAQMWLALRVPLTQRNFGC
jgi:hypothetical protein